MAGTLHASRPGLWRRSISAYACGVAVHDSYRVVLAPASCNAHVVLMTCRPPVLPEVFLDINGASINPGERTYPEEMIQAWLDSSRLDQLPYAVVCCMFGLAG